MKQLIRTWLTVDCDDLRHIPRHHGHPTRTKVPINSKVLSEDFQAGMKGFESWMKSHNHPVTLFVIADLLDSNIFKVWLCRMIEENKTRITIGCHGLEHKSWSAWPEDSSGFTTAIIQASKSLQEAVGEAYRPWFRAPAGYMAPWMAPCLKKCGIIIDSSINDTVLTKSKSGKGNTWQEVRRSITENALIEREWLTRWKLPVNGPALSKFPLSVIAKRAWRKLPPVLQPNDLTTVLEDSEEQIKTVYWHILDHARKGGNWKPPVPNFN